MVCIICIPTGHLIVILEVVVAMIMVAQGIMVLRASQIK